jgi:hypothetical protein
MTRFVGWGVHENAQAALNHRVRACCMPDRLTTQLQQVANSEGMPAERVEVCTPLRAGTARSGQLLPSLACGTATAVAHTGQGGRAPMQAGYKSLKPPCAPLPAAPRPLWRPGRGLPVAGV